MHFTISGASFFKRMPRIFLREEWMMNHETAHYRYFSNTRCEYFPCHTLSGDYFNCLFCYCPLYALGDQCGGNFEYLPSGVKSCLKCCIPHGRGGYDYIMSKIGGITDMAKRK